MPNKIYPELKDKIFKLSEFPIASGVPKHRHQFLSPVQKITNARYEWIPGDNKFRAVFKEQEFIIYGYPVLTQW